MGSHNVQILHEPTAHLGITVGQLERRFLEAAASDPSEFAGDCKVTSTSLSNNSQTHFHYPSTPPKPNHKCLLAARPVSHSARCSCPIPPLTRFAHSGISVPYSTTPYPTHSTRMPLLPKSSGVCRSSVARSAKLLHCPHQGSAVSN